MYNLLSAMNGGTTLCPNSHTNQHHHRQITLTNTTPRTQHFINNISLTYIHCSQPPSIHTRFDPTSQCCCIASILTPHCLVAGWFVACNAWCNARCSVPTTATDWWLDINNNNNHHNTSSNVRLAALVYWQAHHGCSCMLPQTTGWCVGNTTRALAGRLIKSCCSARPYRLPCSLPARLVCTMVSNVLTASTPCNPIHVYMCGWCVRDLQLCKHMVNHTSLIGIIPHQPMASCW
jgi:hypothetical protein